MKHETYSKATFRGVIIIAVLMVIIFALPDVIYSFRPKTKIAITELPAEVQEDIRSTKSSEKRYQRKRKVKKYSIPPRKFNPNEYSLEEWQQLGLSEKQAAIVLKFTKYPLKSNADLRKIFVISDELFELIKDSTFYPEVKDLNSFYTTREKKVSEVITPKTVSVNTATLDELLAVKGIGPFFAKQIIRKRDELGGFYSTEQFKEVWKSTEENWNQWETSLIIDETKLFKININTVTAEELKAHPYITWNLANSIVKLRLQIGGFKNTKDLKKSVLMTDELFEKLKHYVTIEE